ncbi:MAG TPA: hypothetical protein VGE07_06975, partial [Herpetosiphonaceae bacterium]
MSHSDWPFDEPQNLAVITLRRIMDGGEPIRYVLHDEDGGDVSEEDAMVVVGLGEMLAFDASLAELADLPDG